MQQTLNVGRLFVVSLEGIETAFKQKDRFSLREMPEIPPYGEDYLASFQSDLSVITNTRTLTLGKRYNPIKVNFSFKYFVKRCDTL